MVKPGHFDIAACENLFRDLSQSGTFARFEWILATAWVSRTLKQVVGIQKAFLVSGRDGLGGALNAVLYAEAQAKA